MDWNRRLPPGDPFGNEPRENDSIRRPAKYGRSRRALNEKCSGHHWTVSDKYLSYSTRVGPADLVFYCLKNAGHVPKLNASVGGHVRILPDLI